MLTEIQFDSPPIAGGRGGPPPTGTFPRGYRVEVSTDGTTWSAPVAEGQGSGRITAIAFAPVRAQLRSHHADRGDRERSGLVD